MELNSQNPRIIWDPWLREIRDIGKTNGLTNFARNEYGQIDLDRVHPSGIAQFTAAGTVLLSNLVREPLAFGKALTVAKRIKDKSVRQLANYGIHTVYLVGGIASLAKDGFDLSLPILLWPVSLIRKTDDFEINRTGNPIINPALVSTLKHGYGVLLDESKVLGLLKTDSDLLPRSVIEAIAAALPEQTLVEFTRTLVIGNFAVEPTLIEESIDPNGNELLSQLAEVVEVKREPEEVYGEPRLVADADATQKRIVAKAIRGESFAVETLPGSGYTQTVVNVLTGLVHDGKKVLVVTPRRQTIGELSERFASLGLGGLLVRSTSVWLDVVGAISRYEKAKTVDLIQAGVWREAAAHQLESYFQLLGQRVDRVGFSPIEALESLSKLSSLANPPSSIAKLSLDSIERFANRTNAIEILNEAIELGMFISGPADSFWFNAKFDQESQIDQALELVRQLAIDVPAKLTQFEDIAARAGFKTAQGLSEIGDYLELLIGVNGTLDRFVPEVFDRDLTELIDATGPRKLSGSMNGATRRRLKKLAKEYLRPGMSVSDLNLSLRDIEQQRRNWQKFSIVAASTVRVSGAGDALVSFRALEADLVRLQQHLDVGVLDLLSVAPRELESTLTSLVQKIEPLDKFAERKLVAERLSNAGLGDVHRDFARLHVSKDRLTTEFELVWWQSAFEELVKIRPEVAAYSSETITRLESDFLDADRNLNSLGVAGFNQLQSHHWNETIEVDSVGASSLKAVLRSREASLESIFQASPSLSKILLQAVAASPYELPAILPKGENFDVALILDAAGSTVGDNIVALGKVRQVIAFGDGIIAAPVGFELEANEQPTILEALAPSVFDEVARIFGMESMRRNWRPTGQTLGRLVNREFYQGRIIFEPTASEYNGRSNLDLRLVKAKSGGESPVEEVREAVEVVVRHAVKNPADSLMLITASELHADNIQNALSQRILDHAELKQFFDSHGDEKFEVTHLNELSHRVADHVIFAPGFSIDEKSLAPEKLGELSEPSARRTFANMLVSARKSLTVVTGLTESSLSGNVSGAVKQFAKIFAQANSAPLAESEFDSDPMLQDLALRLRKLGAHVTLGYTERIPMAVSFGAVSMVIIPDWHLVGDDLTEKVRLRPALLSAMGWKPFRVHALDVFVDPQRLAIRIADELGMAASQKSQTLFDEPSFDESDVAWGDKNSGNETRLLGDKPPHWS